MKKILLSLLTFYTTAWANECGWSAAAEWLYFLPSFDQNAYVTDGPLSGLATITPGTVARVGERQRFASAYRVEATCLGRHATTLRYTQFQHTAFFSRNYEEVSQVLGIPDDRILENGEEGAAAFDRDYRYYTIDGFLQMAQIRRCRTNTALGFGIKFAHLHIKEKANYFDLSTAERQFVEPDMRAWMLGPAANLTTHFSLTHCLSVTGKWIAALSACESRSRTTITGAPDNSTLLIKNSPHFWHVIGSYDVRLGLSFQKRFLPCFTFNLEGGYELLSEKKALSRIYNVDDTAGGFSFDEWSDFTLMGPYLRFHLTY